MLSSLHFGARTFFASVIDFLLRRRAIAISVPTGRASTATWRFVGLVIRLPIRPAQGIWVIVMDLPWSCFLPRRQSRQTLHEYIPRHRVEVRIDSAPRCQGRTSCDRHRFASLRRDIRLREMHRGVESESKTMATRQMRRQLCWESGRTQHGNHWLQRRPRARIWALLGHRVEERTLARWRSHVGNTTENKSEVLRLTSLQKVNVCSGYC